ncbi:MAG TPA: heme-binding protein [Anaeromyxobacter sp.]|nr:heme-binding protein [Anaeromyxobacter sp.]
MQDTHDLAEKEAALAVVAIREELARRGKTAVIAVSDAHGELVSLLRMDGAPLPSIQVAIRKCWTAARERAATGELGRRFQEQGWQMMNSDPLFTGWDGGAPVVHRGQVVGAVAVSGLSQEEDAELARLGIDRILRALGG